MDNYSLARFLFDNAWRIPCLPVVTGFDGFIDEIISVVAERHSLTDFRRIETIEGFAERVARAAGHSSLREIVITKVDPGGCAINMGDGLVSLGLPVTTFATVGKPMHAAFLEYAGKARLISWGDEPGRTLAYEFADGKIMFSAVSHLKKFHPEAIQRYLDDGMFASICAAAKSIAITNWTLYPHMTACWEYLLDSVFTKVPERPSFFFDLVDPSSRCKADVLDMLKVMRKFADVGKVTLGLNQNEANILSLLTGGMIIAATDPEMSGRQCCDLRASLGIDALIIHSLRYAVGSEGDAIRTVWGSYCEKPKKSTGAGDRFNSGFVLGQVLALSMEDSLTLACASSGFFVRRGRSPTLSELIGFLNG